MAEDQDKIDQLIAQLEWLIQRQDSISKETTALHNELRKLQEGASTEKKIEKAEVVVEKTTPTAIIKVEEKKEPVPQKINEQTSPPPVTDKTGKFLLPKAKKNAVAKGDLEKFIGENLINKIGIAIVVIGVAIGAKYSIEHDLVSPLTRIILGYLTSIGLLGFGIKLKKKYHNYSAVLVSGAIAIMYFLTFASY
ncbi:MAG: DUF2339 domain-containing protein, partial [Flavobacteriales bacterium]|nr:DUF2339 domain-containing protein [Flavobacteriales bacterium]